MKRWGERFLESTRGQVVQLLRRGEATVNELAESLDLTDNAVRSHLTSLERDGLVSKSGKRPGVRKPEAVYELRAEAEQLFPKSYHVLISRLLDAVADRLSQSQIEEILREAGSSIGSRPSDNDKPDQLKEQVDRILDVVRDLGGLARVSEVSERHIVGFSCPVGLVATEHPEICKLIEALLTEVAGRPVREQCDRSVKPRCIFELG
ncbi:MAG TPA: ArsR family transcriptional regulator [Rhodothermales bacterium]|nr:ArsR family transcriptional regulator [Rhodothermales bacterium]